MSLHTGLMRTFKRFCSKDGVLEECGAPRNPGKRTDLESTVGLLRESGGDL